MAEGNKHTDFEELIKQHASEDGSIPADAISAIVTAIKTAVGNEYVDKARYTLKLAEIKQLKEDAMTAEDNAATAPDWKAKYETLDNDFKAYKQAQETEKQKATVEAKFRELLKDMNVSEAGVAKILKWRGVDGIELDEDGKISNSRELRKSIKEDWPEYISTETTQGAQTANPPANNGGISKTREDILKITDDAEMVRAIEANPAAFGLA